MTSRPLDKHLKLNIVIVDDRPEEHFFIKNALRNFCNIVYNDYYSGEDFLHFLEEQSKKQPSDKNFPDIVILDVNMPKLTGFEVFDLVEKKGLKHKICFYILTTSITDREKNLCEKYQLKCYEKPFNLDYFVELLEEIIKETVQK